MFSSVASSASLEEIFLLFTKSLQLYWGKYFSSPLGIFPFPGGNIPPVHHFSSTTLGEIFLLSDRSFPLPGGNILPVHQGSSATPGDIFLLSAEPLLLPPVNHFSSNFLREIFLLPARSLSLSWRKYSSSSPGLFRYLGGNSSSLLGLFRLPGGNIPPVHQVSSAILKEIFLLFTRSLPLPGRKFLLSARSGRNIPLLC
jgi:hypothetical protein